MTDQPKTTVITGAGSGIGLTTALHFARLGNRVFAGDVHYSHEAKQTLRAAGVETSLCDVRQVADINQLIDAAVQETGQIDALVNNAGVGLVAQIENVSEDDWQRVVDTNLKAAFFGCKSAIAHMVTQPTGGSIVNVASNAGLLPRSHDPVYSISKMALAGLTKSLALCHSKDKVRVNAVCPGPVERTNMIEENFADRPDRQAVVRELIAASPLARAWDRMISPEEVAESIAYLCSDGARMISGTCIAIDGGKSLGVPPPAE
ncbi:SDR family NAD(P)-dependent oxidoreductase [Fuerstiella marisgermanici]|uniref:Glucose 1-dehydrogenase 2 n=1 Tax=Fuerstiella marisgermanici TaxID=1891926 RepID=A0A1P8WGE4_9PLAN|nr:SDR family oxidoreductase [Fuerstiella marisgermanici]APZ93114.1 Glucose 1-dehydrogenase 2 [Fuerstiella marisgermanici]